MFIFQRYIAQNIVFPFLVFTFLITGLIWVFQVLKFVHLIDKNIGFTQFCSLIILLLPYLLFIILPFSTVISIIYAYNRLLEERVLTILRSVGISNIELARPALIIATIVTVVSYYISAVLVPNASIKLKTELNILKNSYVSSVISAKTFYQISKDITIYVDQKYSNNTMQGIVLFDDRTEGVPTIILAQYGKLQINNKGNLVLKLVEGARQTYDKNQELSELHFNSLIVELINSSIPTAGNDNSEYYISDLLNPSSVLPMIRQNKLIAEGHERLIWPMYPFILTFVTLAVFLKVPYNKRSTFNHLLYSVAAIIIVTFCNFTIQNIASKNVNMIVGCYLNFIIFIIFSCLLYLPLSKQDNNLLVK